MKVYISEKENNEGVNLTFTPIMKQIGEYKTFSKLPYYPLTLLQKDNVKLAQVEDYEQKAGSTEEERSTNEYKTSEISQIQYKLKASTDPTAAYGRIHIFYTTDKNGDAPDNLGSVQIGALLFKETSLGVWKYGNTWVATRKSRSYSAKRASRSFAHQVTTTSLYVKATIWLLISPAY